MNERTPVKKAASAVKKSAPPRAPVKRQTARRSPAAVASKPVPVVKKTAVRRRSVQAAVPEPAAVKRSYNFLSAVGRRKEAVARVRLFDKGSGKITVNGQEFTKYFPTFDLQYVVLQPLKLLGLATSVDFTAKVLGGGKFGQAEAVRHGMARSLLLLKPEHRQALRTAGYLTRDARVKERKKYGLKKARRGPQFSKR